MSTYEIYYPSSSSIGFTKTDDKGNKSTFYLYVLPETDGAEKLTPIIVVDSELQEEKRFFRRIEPDAKKVVSEFHKWAPDAPMDYPIKIGDHIEKYFRTSEVKKEKSMETEAGTDGVKVKAIYKKTEELK